MDLVGLVLPCSPVAGDVPTNSAVISALRCDSVGKGSDEKPLSVCFRSEDCQTPLPVQKHIAHKGRYGLLDRQPSRPLLHISLGRVGEVKEKFCLSLLHGNAEVDMRMLMAHGSLHLGTQDMPFGPAPLC